MKSIIRIAMRCAYGLALCYWFLFRPTESGAYVAVWHGDRLLLIKNSYKRGYTFPAGGLKRNESSRDAAVRELAEEVDVIVSPEQLRFAQEFESTSEFKLDRSTVFELRLESEPAITVDGIEVVEFEFVCLADIESRKLTSIARQYIRWLAENENR